MRRLAFALPVLLIATAFAADNPPPTDEQQTAMLGNIGHFVEQYLTTLPNLICVQTTEQYQGNKKGDRWHKGDTLTARLALVNGREKRTLELVNNTPLQKVTKAWRRPLTTEGEFGDMLANALAESSAATIKWNRWDTVGGQKVAVFDYSIDQQHSTLRLSLSNLAHAVTPYAGSLFADPVSGTVWRITNVVTEIPPELKILEMQTTLDYGQVSIAGKPYILPIRATVVNKNPDSTIRNEIAFSDYRKFEAESTIKFDTEPEPAPTAPPH